MENTKSMDVESVYDMARRLGLLVKSSDQELTKVINETITNNPDIISEYKNGNKKAINSLVGIVLKKTKNISGKEIHRIIVDTIYAAEAQSDVQAICNR